MNAASIGSLLAGTANKVTAEVATGIWRNSYDVDDPRAQVGRPFGDGSPAQSLAVIDAIAATARAWAKESKARGKAHGLTCNMIETLCTILRSCMNFKTGDIEASYNQIVKATTFARDTVNRHIKALREQGWLDWVRRSVKTDNGAAATTTNSYFFEISRLPLAAQIHLRQLLHKRGIVLASHPERKGSGGVPSLAQRMAERIAKGCKGVADRLRGQRRTDRLVDDAAFIRAEMALFGDLPTEQWAKLRHPHDAAAQRAYNIRLGIGPSSVLPSPDPVNDSPPEG